MIEALDIIADDSLATAWFACDLTACKGACCTMPGGRGAPVAEDEVEPMAAAVEPALTYLSDRNRAYIAAHGYLEGRPGDRATRCIEGRDCVFVYYRDDVATCAIERAHFDGLTPFRKPLSCHLFPIRVGDVLGGPYLRYERIPECEPARRLGAANRVPLHRFLKDALTRAFGRETYRALEKQIERLLEEKRPKSTR